MFVVLVSDVPMSDDDPRLEREEIEIVGPFDTRDEAVDWAMDELRYIVNVYPVQPNFAH